jgi:hypothetical protein
MKLSAFFASATLALAVCGPAGASELFNLGSTFNVSGTNAPNTYTASPTLNSGSTTIDSGALTVTQSFVNVPGGEWFVFDLRTTSGGSIGTLGTNWTVNVGGVQANQLVTALQAYSTFGVSGVLSSPAACITANPCTIETNPITGSGSVYRANNFSGTGMAGGFNTSILPFDALQTSGAFPSATALNEYQFGFEVRAATPLPAALPLFATGIGGLGLFGWRRKRRAQVSASAVAQAKAA